jgi:hypothetical protein
VPAIANIKVSLLIATISHGLESFYSSGLLFPSLSKPFSPVPITVKTSYYFRFISLIA